MSPDGTAALVQLRLIQAPETQGLVQIVLQIVGSRETRVTHQKPTDLHQIGVGWRRGSQQSIHQVPIGRIQRMNLLVFTHGNWPPLAQGSHLLSKNGPL